MNPKSFTHRDKMHCVMCGGACIGRRGLEDHLAHVHRMSKAGAFSLANLLVLDIDQYVKAEHERETLESAIAWDITASQAAGRDVPRRQV